MKFALTGLIFVLLMLGACPKTAGGEAEFRWLTDLDEARALAKIQQQPLLIVFRCEP